MAFKPERPTPFNEMAHLDPDTVRFALSMRESEKNEEEDWMVGLTDEERAIIEEENKKKKAASRLRPCKVKDCVKTEQEVGYQLLERASLIKKIESTEEKVKECADDITSLMELSESTEMQLDKLTTNLAALKAKEKKELKEKLIAGRKMTNQLENQITKLQAWIRKHMEDEVGDEPAEKEESRGQSSTLPTIDFNLTNAHKKCDKKHTGVFRTSASGFPQWSCCRASDEDEPGCQDDQSVGVRSTLVQRPASNFKPYTIRQAEHETNHREKMASLHGPSKAPVAMNKGYRDARQVASISQFNTSLGMGNSQVSTASRATSKKSRDEDSRSRRSGETLHKSEGGPKPDVMTEVNSPINLGKASISYLESSMLKRSHEQMRFTRARPSSAAANGYMGSMRQVQETYTSGPFPVSRMVDLGADSYFQGRMTAKSMPRSNVSIDRLTPGMRMLDSASLLASYNEEKRGKAVGLRRHLGLKDMHRLHGRPSTATSGPHLRQTSTMASSSSLEHYCARIV